MSLVKNGELPAEPLTRASVAVSDIENWAEIPAHEVIEANKEAKCEEAYKARVEELIAERYSLREELAIHRQRDSKPEEFAEYNDFAEACKARARKELEKNSD
ncbi:MAG: hypothetical protein K2M14_07335 [Muribaculaceae bacterium]|nr:hypothetical protein [Muribaculaceae bacterium]